MASTPEQKHARYLRHREEVIAARAAWRKANPDLATAQAHEHYLRNREKRRAQISAWSKAHNGQRCDQENARRRANRAHYRDLERQYRKANPEPYRLLVARRRALRANAPGSHTLQEWREKCALFANLCAYCGRGDVLLARDHKIPLTRGGSDDIANIVPACGSCNSRKGARTDREYLAALEQLRAESLAAFANRGSGGLVPS